MRFDMQLIFCYYFQVEFVSLFMCDHVDNVYVIATNLHVYVSHRKETSLYASHVAAAVICYRVRE